MKPTTAATFFAFTTCLIIIKKCGNQITWIFTFAFCYKPFFFALGVWLLCSLDAALVFSVARFFSRVGYLFGTVQFYCVGSHSVRWWERTMEIKNEREKACSLFKFGAGCNCVCSLYSTGYFFYVHMVFIDFGGPGARIKIIMSMNAASSLLPLPFSAVFSHFECCVCQRKLVQTLQDCSEVVFGVF